MIKLLQDAAIFFRDSESLFVDRIKSVVIVGGLETHHRPNGSRKKSSIQLFFNAQRDDQQRTSASFSPDRSEATNAFDLPAAFFFYQRCFDFKATSSLNHQPTFKLKCTHGDDDDLLEQINYHAPGRKTSQKLK